MMTAHTHKPNVFITVFSMIHIYYSIFISTVMLSRISRVIGKYKELRIFYMLSYISFRGIIVLLRTYFIKHRAVRIIKIISPANMHAHITLWANITGFIAFYSIDACIFICFYKFFKKFLSFFQRVRKRDLLPKLRKYVGIIFLTRPEALQIHFIHLKYLWMILTALYKSMFAVKCTAACYFPYDMCCPAVTAAQPADFFF